MNVYDSMTVAVPEGECDGMRVERFTVTQDVETLRNAMIGRDIPDGTYTRLMDGHTLWMSDTPAEKDDHLDAVWQIRRPGTKRVLINGLGLGMVVAAALACDHVEHIDIVESDERVIKLVGPHYEADPRVTIHHADAYEQAKNWPPGTRWDVAWHDIWPNLCEDNLPEMSKLARSYGKRVAWQGSWGKEFLMARRYR